MSTIFSNQEIVDVMEPILKKRRDNLDELRTEYNNLKELLERGSIKACGTDLDMLHRRICIVEKNLMEDEAYIEGLKASL